MIENISIKNFKSLKDISINLKGLDLLMGLNSSGKSSLIQALLLLKQSRDLHNGSVLLNDRLVNVGVGKDALYQYNDESDLINIEVTDSKVENKLSWDLKYESDSQVLTTDDLYRKELLERISLFSENFQYLSSERIPPTDGYKSSTQEVSNNNQVGIKGEFAVHYLFEFGRKEIPESLCHTNGKSSSLLHQVDAWLSEISPGTKLNTENFPSLEAIKLDFQFETKEGYTNNFKPKNVGFGLTYVLPVIISLLSAEEDRLIIIENPESHIHPKGQSELGKLIAKAVNAGAQVLIETHSDHIVNGVRVAVKKEVINSKKVGLNYFERVDEEREQFTKVTNIQLDKNGELSEYPENLLDEWSNQLIKLV